MWIRTFAVLLFSALAAGAPGRAVSADLMQAISADTRMTLFARAVVKSGMAPLLREPGTFLIFVPSDQALANEGSAFLLDSVLLTASNAGRLVDLVRHHIVRVRGDAIELDEKGELQTLAGVPLVVTRVGTGLLVDCCAVVTDRIATENGVVHVVDRLLWPRDRRWQSGATPSSATDGALLREPAGDQQTLHRR
jgi:uncharacterized surface protein with fasciclin (FAS1) repeats